MNPKRKSWQPIIVIALATTAVFIWSLFVRSTNLDFPFYVENWSQLEWIEPYYIGFAIQEAVVPMGLIYLFSRTALFRRVVTEQVAEHDTLKLTAVLITIQTIALLYRFGLYRAADEGVTLGLFIVIIAGLLGGWRVGASVGLFSMLAIGWFDYMLWMEPGEVFELPEYFEYYVLKHFTTRQNFLTVRQSFVFRLNQHFSRHNQQNQEAFQPFVDIIMNFRSKT